MAKKATEQVLDIMNKWPSGDVPRGMFGQIVIELAERIDKLEQKQKINIL